MVTEAQEYKTSEELGAIAAKMIVVLLENYDLTRSEMSMIIFLMGDGRQYLNMKDLIKKVVKNE